MDSFSKAFDKIKHVLEKAQITIFFMCFAFPLYAQYSTSELAYFAMDSYEDTVSENIPLNFTRMEVPGFTPSRRFNAVKYENKDTIIISYRGTDNAWDAAVDTDIAVNEIMKWMPVLEKSETRPFKAAADFLNKMSEEILRPLLEDRFRQARDFYRASTANTGKKVIIVGHSLGGLLAQIVGNETGAETHTFNAPGAREYVDDANINGSNITNHLSLYDPVSNAGVHIGSTKYYNHFDYSLGHSMEGFYRYLVEEDKAKK